MKLLEVKEALKTMKEVNFELPNGFTIPKHYHLTELGKIEKHFMDCGGVERKEHVANFQLWIANDRDHRLKPEKFTDIIEMSQEKLGLGDVEVEVEYQFETINKYGLEFNGTNFVLTNLQTDCLAKDKCGIPEEQLVETKAGGCTPGSGCC